jgi:hypothetical protein
MKKETLERANELENQIEHYELLSYIMSYPYQRYRLFKKKPRVNHARSTSVDIVISDKELTKLIGMITIQSFLILNMILMLNFLRRSIRIINL